MMDKNFMLMGAIVLSFLVTLLIARYVVKLFFGV